MEEHGFGFKPSRYNENGNVIEEQANPNFDRLQDKVLDIKDNLYNQLREIREQVCQFLTTRPNNRFYFAKEIKEKINFSVAYRDIERFGMHNAKRMKAVYIEYVPNKKDFFVHGYLKANNEAVKSEISARDLDLDSLYNIVDYLAQYQREQNGTAKTAKQIEPEERLMLAVYNNAPENYRKSIPLPKRTRFALVLREC